MRQAKEREIIEVVIAIISVQMSNLARFCCQVSMKSKTYATAATAKKKNMFLDFFWDRYAGHSRKSVAHC
jgi:hypothetical protein